MVIHKLIYKPRKKVGLPPGTPVYTGDQKHGAPTITVIDYDDENIREKKEKKWSDCLPYINSNSVTWINIDRLSDISLLETIGKDLDIHSLVIEDIVNIGQRPKAEDYDNYLFVTLIMLSYAPEEHEITGEQVSLILKNNVLITFQERSGDVFDIIRDRLRNHKGKIRKMGIDYLAYSLIDAIVDQYFLIFEKIGEQLETLDEEVLLSPTKETMASIYKLKQELIFLRKAIWPLRDIVNGFVRGDSPQFKKLTLPYLRDVYDHTIQVMDILETYRDTASGLMDLYLSSISNRMNEVMKVLTMMSTIFIPLGFIAGLYGMNFENMPELKFAYGYFIILGVMASVAIGMLIVFKRKKWL